MRTTSVGVVDKHGGGVSGLSTTDERGGLQLSAHCCLVGIVVRADIGEEVVCACSARWAHGDVDSEDDTCVGGVELRTGRTPVERSRGRCAHRWRGARCEVDGRSVVTRTCWPQRRTTTMVVYAPCLLLPLLLSGLCVPG